MVRLACVGGFLGEGKTTALIEAARNMIARGSRVEVITNDQGSHLVDTVVVRSRGLQTEEITGGCFCWRFSEFERQLGIRAAVLDTESFAPAPPKTSGLAAYGGLQLSAIPLTQRASLIAARNTRSWHSNEG
jgi:hypothetical protein